MRMTVRQFIDNSKCTSWGDNATYEFQGHKVAILGCERCSRYPYYYAVVDGVTIVKRALRDKCLRLAVEYLNNLEA